MSRVRIGAGVTGVALGLIMFGGVAGAQQVGTDQSDVLPNNEVTNPTPGIENDQLGEEITAPGAPGGEEAATGGAGEEAATGGAGEAAGAAAQAAPTGSLPLTGGDVVGLAVIGAAAVGAGTVLIRRGRTRTSAA